MMVKLTLIYAAVLIALGLAGYLGTGQSSKTALIPAFFGLGFLVLGAVGRRASARRHAMHAASALAMIAMLGAARGLPGGFALLSGGEVERPAAAISQSLMFFLSLGFLVFAFRSFAQARRAR